MKDFFHRGVLAFCAVAFAVSVAGCSRNVSSENEVDVAQNPESATPNATQTPQQPEAPKPATAPKSTATALHWEPNLDAALALARQTQKPIMIDFFATWCGPCKLLDAEIYPAAPVVAEGQNFVSVKIDVDKEAAIAQKYKISAMPTIVFLSASGKEIHRTQGMSRDPAWMVQEMQTARARVAPTPA